MLKRLLSYLYHYGTDQTDDPKTKRDIRMLTMGLLICAMDAAVFAPLNWRAGNIPSTIAHMVISLSLLMVIRVNKTNHKLAFFLTFIIVESGLFYLAVYAIPKGGIEYYFLLMAFVLHAFSIDRMTYMVMTLMNTMMFGLSLYMVPPLTSNRDYIYTPLALFTVTLLITRLVRIQKNEYEKLINEQNKKLENQSQELQKLNNLKSEFFANISHELRTPLTLVQGQIEALKPKPKNELELEDRIKKASRNTSQLAHMIDDLLDLSRLELNALTVQPTPVDMIRFIRRTVASFQSLAESRQVRLGIEENKLSKTVALVDTRQFEKVVSNLLYNAFKFTVSGGLVQVSLSEREGNIMVRVFNTGQGIPEADVPRLFDRFYQAGLSAGKVDNHPNEIEGTGLGLAIAKEIVELHNGTITVTNVEGGVAFTTTVPSTDESLVTHEPEPREQLDISKVIDEKLAAITSGKPLILVVEDNAEMHEYLDEVLSPYFRLEKTSNGKEALDKLAALKPQLILADVMMPEMNGFELLERLKKSASWFHIPVMFLTALASREKKLEGLRMGLDDYLIKPFDREELVMRTANLIGNLKNRMNLSKEITEENITGNTEQKISAADETLIRKATAYIESRVSDSSLSVSDMAGHLGLSQRQFYRRCVLVTGMSPVQWIIEVKLQYARKLLIAGKITKLSQLAWELGYSSDSHFSRIFFERFGKRPSDYLE